MAMKLTVETTVRQVGECPSWKKVASFLFGCGKGLVASVRAGSCI